MKAFLHTLTAAPRPLSATEIDSLDIITTAGRLWVRYDAAVKLLGGDNDVMQNRSNCCIVALSEVDEEQAVTATAVAEMNRLLGYTSNVELRGPVLIVEE